MPPMIGAGLDKTGDIPNRADTIALLSHS